MFAQFQGFAFTEPHFSPEGRSGHEQSSFLAVKKLCIHKRVKPTTFEVTHDLRLFNCRIYSRRVVTELKLVQLSMGQILKFTV